MNNASPSNVIGFPPGGARGGGGDGSGGDSETRLAVLEAKFDATIPTLAKREDVATLLATLSVVARKEDVAAVETRVFEAINGQTWKLIGSAAALVAVTAAVMSAVNHFVK